MPVLEEMHNILVATENEMTLLGQRLAKLLDSGDTLLLSGPIGAGKTHLARAIIRTLVGEAEEIPSPTFTLVQVYDRPDGTIWHADLYRLGDSSEVIELGLDEAVGEAIVIIEWPDRLPEDFYTGNALEIQISPRGDARKVDFRSDGTRWQSKLRDL